MPRVSTSQRTTGQKSASAPPAVGWRERLRSDPLPWLLEEDEPAVRYLALRDLLDRPATDPALLWTASDIPSSPAVRALLDRQHPAGYWARPGAGCFAAYRGTLWTLVLLAEMEMTGEDPAVQRGCRHLLSDIDERGELTRASLWGWRLPLPISALCLPGNALFALHRLGPPDGPRLEALASRLAERSLATGWRCLGSGNRPCWWAAVKTLKGFAELPERGGAIAEATGRGVELLLSLPYWAPGHPAASDPNWARFGFPLFDGSDLLEMAEVLVRLGQAGDPRLAEVVALIAGKQDAGGTWSLERSPNGRMQAAVEAEGEPSKWITLRALRVLKGAAEAIRTAE